MSEPLLFFLMLLAAFYILTSIIAIGQIVSDGFGLPLTPADVYYEYEEGKLNWFGATMLYLLTVLIFPMYYILAFIKFIFTVGRK